MVVKDRWSSYKDGFDCTLFLAVFLPKKLLIIIFTLRSLKWMGDSSSVAGTTI